jgi:hypothetical protein
MRTPCLKDGLKESVGERKNGSSPRIVAFSMPFSTWAFLQDEFGVQPCKPSLKSHRMAVGASCAWMANVQRRANSSESVFFMVMPVLFIDGNE